MNDRRCKHRMNRLMHAVIMLAITMLASAMLTAIADEPDAQELLKRWHAFYEHDAATNYRLRYKGEDTPLTLDRKPILRWTNPLEDGQIHGAAYVWTKDERPIVIGQFFSYLNGNGGRVYCHAFHSLADKPVEALHKGNLFWSPDRKGIDLQPIASDAPPASSRVRRLSQMRDIARRVTAHTEETTRGKRVLRLMPQPLYRYPEKEGRPDDGAIFSFAVGNDPEVLLVVESLSSSTGPQWRIGFARSTRSTSVAYLDEREMWRYESGERKNEDPTSTYLSVHGIATLPLVPEISIDEPNEP